MIIMDSDTLVNGRRTNQMDKDKKSLLMAVDTKDLLIVELSMAILEHSFGLMEKNIKDSSNKVIWMDKVD